MRASDALSLADVYASLGVSMLAGAGTVESPGCLVEQAVANLMDDFRREAEALLVKRLSEKTLADIAAAVKRLMKKDKSRNMHGT